MKRNKIIAVALVVMMMVGAVVLMSCSKCPGEGDCVIDPSSLDAYLKSIDTWCFSNVDDQAKLNQQINDCFGSYDGTGKVECDC